MSLTGTIALAAVLSGCRAPTQGPPEAQGPEPEDTDSGPSHTAETGIGDTAGEDTQDTAPAVPCAGRETGPQVGQCGPDFTLPDGRGGTVSLYDFAGNIIIIDISGFS